MKKFFRILLVLIVFNANAIAIFLRNADPFPTTEKSCLNELIDSFNGYFTAAYIVGKGSAFIISIHSPPLFQDSLQTEHAPKQLTCACFVEC